MADLPDPRHVRNVQQALDAGLDLDERTEVRDLAHLAGDHVVGGVALFEGGPRVGREVLETEVDLLRIAIDADYLDVHLFADHHGILG